MFDLFDRGSKSFSVILLLAVVALVYFSQNSSQGPMGYREAGTGRKDDDYDDDDDVAGEEGEVEGEGATILYSRVVGEELDVTEEKVIETITEEKPQSMAQVLFSRIVGKSYEEEKPYKVLYSRSFGLEN